MAKSKQFYYPDANGKTQFRVIWVPGKGEKEPYIFLQHEDDKGDWVKGAGTNVYPLYNLPAVSKASIVLFVENEQEADHLIQLGFCATTTAGNFTAWKKEYMNYLSYKEVVFLLHKPGAKRDIYKNYALKLLAGMTEDWRVLEVRSVRIIEWSTEILDIETAEDVNTVINKTPYLSASDITFDEAKIFSKQQAELEEMISRLDAADTDAYKSILKMISWWDTVADRRYLLKKLAAKRGLMLPDIETDFVALYGTVEPMDTLYFNGLVDIADYWETSIFVMVEGGCLIQTETAFFDNQLYRVPSDLTTELTYCDFKTLEKHYMEAKQQVRHDTYRNKYEASFYDRMLFRDVKQFVMHLGKFEEAIAELITNFIFLTYIHDSEEITHLPLLYLQFDSKREMDAFNHPALAELSFRGVIQNHLNEYHIVRLSDYHATCYFIRDDFEKTVERKDMSDLFRERCHDIGSRCCTVKKGYRNVVIAQNVFSPTIIASTKAPVDERIAANSLCIRVEPFIASTKVPVDKGIASNNLSVQGIPIMSRLHMRDLKGRLTAWRAVTMGIDRLPWVECSPMFEGLLKIVPLINPDGADLLLKTIERVTPQQESAGGKMARRVVEVLAELYPKHDAESHDFGSVAEVTTLLNNHLRENLTVEQVGHLLKQDLGITTSRIKQGARRNSKGLTLTQKELRRLMQQFGIRETLVRKLDASIHAATQIMRSM